jgi:hypothetical protein
LCQISKVGRSCCQQPQPRPNETSTPPQSQSFPSHRSNIVDSLSLSSGAACICNSHPFIVGEEQVSRTKPRKKGPTVNMSKSIYSLTKVGNNTHGQETYLAGGLDFYTHEQCDSHARAGDQTQVLSRSPLIQHPSWLTACDSQFLPQGKLSASPRARYTSKKKKNPLCD